MRAARWRWRFHTLSGHGSAAWSHAAPMDGRCSRHASWVCTTLNVHIQYLIRTFAMLLPAFHCSAITSHGRQQSPQAAAPPPTLSTSILPHLCARSAAEAAKKSWRDDHVQCATQQANSLAQQAGCPCQQQRPSCTCTISCLAPMLAVKCVHVHSLVSKVFQGCRCCLGSDLCDDEARVGVSNHALANIHKTKGSWSRSSLSQRLAVKFKL